MKLPAIPGMEDFEGTAFHTARWDYELHRRRARRAAHQARPTRSSALIGTGASGIQCRAAAGRVGEARLRVPAHAVGDRGAGQPAHRPRVRRRAAARLAAGADGQLPGAHARPAGRRGPRRRRVDAPLRAPSNNPPSTEGHDDRGVHRASGRGARLRDHGGAPRSGSRSSSPTRPPPRCSSRTTGTCASGRASTTSTSPAFNNPNVTLIDCPAGIERITEQGPVVDGAAVRGRLHRLRHRLRGRAHAALRAAPATTSSAAAASRWPRSGPTASPACSG